MGGGEGGGGGKGFGCRKKVYEILSIGNIGIISC